MTGNGGLRAALAVGFVVLVASCTASGPPAAPPGPAPDNSVQRSLVADVSGAGAEPHLAALQRIADENGGNRVSPGPGYEASVEYVVGVLRAAGYDVTTPTYPHRLGRRQGGGEVVLRNVVAQTRTGDPGRVVMAGAHLDSVEEGPGINDNGSGVAALLEIATRLGGSPPVTNAVRFAFWGSEEDGMIGSTHYVETLSAAERDALELYLNLDMVASPNAGYFVQGGAGRGASQAGPPGSAEVGRVLVDQLRAVGVTAQLIPFEEDSDDAPFVAAGIPTGAAFTGDDEEKTDEQAARWGGRAGEVFDRCYHEACDGLGNLDRTALDRFTDAVAGTLAHFAMTPEPLPSG